MQRADQQPSLDHIHRACRGIQRHWDRDERQRRAKVAVVRQRQLLQLLAGRLQSAVA